MLKTVLRRTAKRIYTSLFDRALPPPSPRERELVEQLRARFSGFPVHETAGATPSAASWLSNMNRLRQLVLSQDPREFLRWDVIINTMFVGNVPFVRSELNYLKERPDWDSRWRSAIAESTAGHPGPCVFHSGSSGNLIHHAYHVAQWEQATGIKPSDLDLIVEFGGGYGSMCRLHHQLGFRGQYVIFDLPSFSALQTFYLQQLGLKVANAKESDAAANVLCTSEVAELRSLLRGAAERKSLFIATWSLSETPLTVRLGVMPLLEQCSNYLLAYQDQFEEVDNVSFFTAWQASMPHVEWQSQTIPHLAGNRYLFGRS